MKRKSAFKEWWNKYYPRDGVYHDSNPGAEKIGRAAFNAGSRAGKRKSRE